MKKISTLFSLCIIIISFAVLPLSAIAETVSSNQGSTTGDITKKVSSSTENQEINQEESQILTNTTSESTTLPTKEQETPKEETSATKIQPRAPTARAIKDWGSQFITNSELQDDEGNTQGSFDLYANMQAHWDFSIPAGTEIQPGDTMTVDVPDVFTLQTRVEFDIKDASGAVIGHAVADNVTGKVTITFTDYASEAASNGITGSFNLWVTWDKTKVSEDTTVTVDWGNTGTTEVDINPGTGPDPNEVLYKWGWYDIDDPSIIHWRVRVNYAEQSINNAVYTDFIGANQTLISGSVEAYQVDYDDEGNNFDILYTYPSSATVENGATEFTTTLGDIQGCVVIDYTTKITDGGASSRYQNQGQLVGDNIVTQTVDVYSPDNGGNGDGETKTSILGEKTWVDDNDAAGIRPVSIIIDLYRNNEKIDSKEVSQADDWKYEFTELPRYDENGTEYTYTVKEEPVDNYVSSQSGSNFINTISGTTQIAGKKTWDDADNQDGKRPESITVNLLANGEPVDSKEVTAADNWEYEFSNLPKYQEGKEITYTVTENAVPEYTTTIDGTNITNSYTPGKTSLTVTKAWQDGNNQDGLRPEGIQVQLYGNGEAVGEPITLTGNNDWTYTWTDLDQKANGETIDYTVQEVTKVSGYETTIQQEAGNVIITNTHTPEVTEIKGVKTWDDADNQDGKRPESITVNLLANGEPVDSKEVTAADNWEYEFSNLPKYQEGKEITYTVTENAVPEYTTTIDGTNITNSYTPGKTSLTVTKAWQDGNNQDGLRPEGIQVQLYGNGEAVGEPITLTGNNDWTYTWTDLDQKANGKNIVYTVTEVTKVKGYETVINDSNIGNIIITNVHTPKSVEPGSDSQKPKGEQNKNHSSKNTLPKTGEQTSIIPLLIGIVLVGIVLIVVLKRRASKK
jgi:LPXTG-motif cell wall-anchored protein